MKKLKYQVPVAEHISSAPPSKSHIFRIERLEDSLVLRTFRLLDASLVGDETVNSSLEPVGPLQTTDLRKIMRERVFVDAAVLTAGEFAVGKCAIEIGRQIFTPDLSEGVRCGHGERNDFAAFVFGMAADGQIDEPYNWFVESMLVKGNLSRVAKLRSSQPICLLYSDKAGAHLDDWTLLYLDSQPFALNDTTSGGFQLCGTDFVTHSLLPTITLSAEAQITPGGQTTVAVNLSRDGVALNYTGELLVEAVSGYVPNTRVAISSGSGSFRVMALGLAVGETLRVKVGSKNITGMAELSIPVA
jgi:hypothetical protein